jgi:hypothetical protein
MEGLENDKRVEDVKLKLRGMSENDEDQHESDNNEIKLLLVINNTMPLLSLSMFDSSTNGQCTRCCPAKQKRMCLLSGLGISSVVSATCFLFGLRIMYPNPRDHIPENVPFGPNLTQLLWCNKTDDGAMDNFFAYPVSLLIWCNETFGICFGVLTAVLLMITICVRHPLYDETSLFHWTSRSCLQPIQSKINFALLVVGWFACINMILLSTVNIIVQPWHSMFAMTCFASFIIYELLHNYFLGKDLWRNGTYIRCCKPISKVGRVYITFTASTLLVGIVSNIVTVVGFVLKGIYGAKYQWMTILSIIGYFLPVYVLISIREYVVVKYFGDE